MRSVLASFLALSTLLPAADLAGQVKPSEPASVSQTVDGTEMRIEYSRPRARGRDHLFGGVIHWDEVWTPGANDATVLDLGADVEIEGREVPAGRWSVWMAVREEGPWELVLDPRDDLWHTAHPEPTDDQIRIPVTPEPTDHTEALTWWFHDLWRAGATLSMAWGTTRVPVEIEVEPTRRYTATPEEAAPFLGAWEIQRARDEGPDRWREAEIRHHEDGSLRLVSPAPESGGRAFEWVLQPKAEGVFSLGWTRDGELFSNGSGTFLEMAFEDGESVTFEVRAPDDDVMWRGRRNARDAGT